MKATPTLLLVFFVALAAALALASLAYPAIEWLLEGLFLLTGAAAMLLGWWAERTSNGRIRNVPPPLTPSSRRLVLRDLAFALLTLFPFVLAWAWLLGLAARRPTGTGGPAWDLVAVAFVLLVAGVVAVAWRIRRISRTLLGPLLDGADETDPVESAAGASESSAATRPR